MYASPLRILHRCRLNVFRLSGQHFFADSSGAGEKFRSSFSLGRYGPFGDARRCRVNRSNVHAWHTAYKRNTSRPISCCSFHSGENKYVANNNFQNTTAPYSSPVFVMAKSVSFLSARVVTKTDKETPRYTRSMFSRSSGIKG